MTLKELNDLLIEIDRVLFPICVWCVAICFVLRFL